MVRQITEQISKGFAVKLKVGDELIFYVSEISIRVVVDRVTKDRVFYTWWYDKSNRKTKYDESLSYFLSRNNLRKLTKLEKALK